MKTVGVIGLQGDVMEHIDMLRRLDSLPIWVNKKSDLKALDAIIIPGGESTTIGELLLDTGLFDLLVSMGNSGTPIFGTCAGAILLAKEGDGQVKKTKTKLLSLMDMKIDRNAFGRQRESFEISLEINGIADKAQPFPCVFIRAPLIEKIHGKCEILAKFENKIVAARQGNLLATCFHPELTVDLRMHRYFLSMIVQ
jgi:5'-phosphate synthase pdxT subunit